jgi:hypothetical protein
VADTQFRSRDSHARHPDLVSQKISKLVHEGKPQRQAVAMALSMKRAGRLREGGVYVRKRKK